MKSSFTQDEILDLLDRQLSAFWIGYDIVNIKKVIPIAWSRMQENLSYYRGKRIFNRSWYGVLFE